MKTCPMCGTLLFDDAEKCTKCGVDLIQKEGEVSENKGKNNAAGEAVEGEGTQEAPETADTEAESMGQTESIEVSSSRKKWLEEQEKIKNELANIMGRVGKKKKRGALPQPTGPTLAPGSTAPTPTPTIPTTPVPSPSVAPVPPMTAVTPAPKQPTPTATQGAQTADAQPQPIAGGAPAGSSPSVNLNVAPSPAQTAAIPQEGLSEVNKRELLGELDDLRNEGYNVTKLETIIEESPASAWRAFSDFLDDIDKLNLQKERLEKINTQDFENFEIQKRELLSKMNDTELLENYEIEITQFENNFLAAKTEKDKKVTGEMEIKKKKDDQLKKLINSGKEAFRLKQYEKAKEIFDKAYELEPNNKEITFFKKKTTTKLMDIVAEPEAVPAVEAEGESGTVEGTRGKKKKKKKKKKVVSKKEGPEEGAPVPSVPVGAQVQPEVTPEFSAPTPAAGGQIAPEPISPQAPMSQPSTQPQKPAKPEPAPTDGPRSAAEFEALGFNAYINKDYPKALEFYEKVLQIDPNFPNVQNIINECLMRLGKK